MDASDGVVAFLNEVWQNLQFLVQICEMLSKCLCGRVLEREGVDFLGVFGGEFECSAESFRERLEVSGEAGNDKVVSVDSGDPLLCRRIWR